MTGGVSGGFGPFLTFGTGSAGIDAWSIGAGGVNLWTNYKGTGNHTIDIIGNSITDGGSMSQIFSTMAGQQYTVYFDLSGAKDPIDSNTNSAVKDMDVTVFGTNLSSKLTPQCQVLTKFKSKNLLSMTIDGHYFEASNRI